MTVACLSLDVQGRRILKSCTCTSLSYRQVSILVFQLMWQHDRRAHCRAPMLLHFTNSAAIVYLSTVSFASLAAPGLNACVSYGSVLLSTLQRHGSWPVVKRNDGCRKGFQKSSDLLRNESMNSDGFHFIHLPPTFTQNFRLGDLIFSRNLFFSL